MAVHCSTATTRGRGDCIQAGQGHGAIGVQQFLQGCGQVVPTTAQAGLGHEAIRAQWLLQRHGQAGPTTAYTVLELGEGGHIPTLATLCHGPGRPVGL